MSFSLRHLEVLTLFSRTKSVTETARLLRISQPAVSQTLKDIEREFGFPILLRVGGRTMLTDELRAILPDVERMLSHASFLRGRINEVRDAHSGSLTIASVPTLFKVILPRTIQAFSAERPNVDISVEVRLREEVLQVVREEKADIGLALLPFDETGLAVEPLIELELACVLPASHPLAGFAALSPDQLSDEQIILQDTHAVRGSLSAQLYSRRNPQRRELTTNQSSAALNLVSQGLGIALIQPIALYGQPLETVAVRPVQPREALTLAMVYSRKRPVGKLIVQFQKYLRAELQRMAEEMAGLGLSNRLL